MKLPKTTPIPLTYTPGDHFANSEYFAYGDYHLHYRIDPAIGTEKAKMLLIHGFGCNTEFFDEVVEYYTKAGIKCVRVDLPDFGYSTRETKGIHYVPQIEMVFALMDELDPDKTGWILVGHSMGGSVSLQMANEDCSRMNAIVLNAPLLMANVPEWLGKLIMVKPMVAFMQGALNYATPYEWLFKMAEYLMTFDLKYVLKFRGGVFMDSFKVADTGEGLCYMTAKTSVPDLSKLKDIDVPVQLVTGGRDLFVFPTKAQQLRDALPAGYDDQRLAKGGHCFVQNFAKETSELALDFLKKNHVI